MFSGAASFNSAISLGLSTQWTQADFMFYQTRSFNQPLDSLGDSSSVETFTNFLSGAYMFNQPVTALRTGSATSLAGMFQMAFAFNQAVSHFDTRAVTSLAYVLSRARSFNQPLPCNTSSVLSMVYSFEGADSFAQELHEWKVGAVTDFTGTFQDSRMAREAVAGGVGFGRACRLHHSWKGQNAGWDPVAAKLVADAGELDLSLCVNHLSSGGLQGDPHLGLAHGGKADFRGYDGCLFSFLSTRNVAVNARLSAATFSLDGSEVHGTFVTEVHVATLDRGTGVWFTASYWADEVGAGNWGWGAVNGSCGGHGFPLYPHKTRACGASRATTGHSSAVFALPEWEVSVQSRPVFDWLEGPEHRLDLSLRPLLPEARLAEWPHGLIGQLFDGDAAPRHGKQDDYSAAVVWTEAQAEGAIEGAADDYRVASPFATDFRFSRFEPADTKRAPAQAPVSASSAGVARPVAMGGMATAEA